MWNCRRNSVLVTHGSYRLSSVVGRCSFDRIFFPSKVYRSISVSGQLPTYPSPNSTTVNWQQVKVNVGLGEGQVGSYLDTDVDPGLLGYMQALRAEERMKIGRRQMIFFSSYYFVFTLLKKEGGNVLFILWHTISLWFVHVYFCFPVFS